MRKIEKETLEIINTYKNEEYVHYEKLITIRENELKENLDKLLYNVINKEKIERERNTMKLILQNNEIKSEEYKKVITKLKKGE